MGIHTGSLSQEVAMSRANILKALHLCLQFKSKVGRWEGNLLTTKLKHMHWRLSDTWFVLMRSHAEVIMDDKDIEREFADNCRHTDTNATRCAIRPGTSNGQSSFRWYFNCYQSS